MLTSIRGLVAASLLAGSGLVAAPAFAQDFMDPPSDITVSANVALVSDYRFRGVSQSGGDPAIQGGITVNHASSGFYVGAWSSSIDGTQAYGEQELNLFGGFSREISPILKLDAGLLYYLYPTGDNYDVCIPGDCNQNTDFFEPYVSLSAMIGPATFKAGAAYAWKQSALGDRDNLYLYGNFDIGVPTTPLTLSGHLGYTDGALGPRFLAGGRDKTGFDWSAGISAAVLGPVSVGVSYVGVEGRGRSNNDTIVATLSASF